MHDDEDKQDNKTGLVIALGLISASVYFIRRAIVGKPRPPRWIPSKSLLEIIQRIRVRYDDAPDWDGGVLLKDQTYTPGAEFLGKYIQKYFPGVTKIGGLDDRRNTATIGTDKEKYSIHATGRADDVHIDSYQSGDRIAEWLVSNSESIGIQYVIWNQTYVNLSSGRSGPYTGPNPHIDHIHVEINESAGRKETPWFKQQESSLVS